MNKMVLVLYAFCAALLCSNGYLLYANHRLVEQHQIDQAMQLPTLGAPMSPIVVRSASGGTRPLMFADGARHDHLLLVMSPDCPYCKKNWPMWDALISGVPGDVDVTYFDVTGKFDQQLSKAHDIRADQLVTAPLDSAIRARIIGTPTTILIGATGNVRHVWEGVLDKAQLGEIVAMAQTDNATQ